MVTVTVTLRPGAHGGHSSYATDFRGLSGVPQNVTFNTGDVADDRRGHGQRRWGEREAGRRATAGGGDDSGHDHGEHYRRRRSAGDGDVRPGGLLGAGHAERGPGAHGGHSSYAYAPGRCDYSGVPQNVTFNTGDRRRSPSRRRGHGQRRWGEREAGWRATAGGGDRGDSGHDHGEHYRFRR